MSDVRFRSLEFLGYPKYEVGTDGSVWSFNTTMRRRLKTANHFGYRWVVLSRNRIRKEIAVHHLVLLAFVGPCPEGQECRHGNGIRDDNRRDNLCWGTRLENVADRERHGTTSRGEKHGRARLSEDDARAILAAFTQGESKASLARRYNVSHAAICDLTKGRSWSHLAGCDQQTHQQNSQRGQRHYSTKLEDEDVRSIRAAVQAGKSQAAVARDFGIKPMVVWKIIQGKTWRHLT